MEYAVGQVVEAMRGAEPQRGEPVEALERVLRATWRQLAQFHGLLALNTARLSAEELHRRHLPMLDQLEPLIERGQKQGVFRSDLPVAWQLAVTRAIVHAASHEIRGGRLPESEAEAAMLSTALPPSARSASRLRRPRTCGVDSRQVIPATSDLGMPKFSLLS